jgi:hypothetical protein
MSQDIVFQMGTIVAGGILTAMAWVAGATVAIMFVETLRHWQNLEASRLPLGNRKLGMALAVELALVSPEPPPGQRLR